MLCDAVTGARLVGTVGVVLLLALRWGVSSFGVVCCGFVAWAIWFPGGFVGFVGCCGVDWFDATWVVAVLICLRR